MGPLLALLALVAASHSVGSSVKKLTPKLSAFFQPISKEQAAEQTQRDHDCSKETSKQLAKDRQAREQAAALTKRKPGRPRKISNIIDPPPLGP